MAERLLDVSGINLGKLFGDFDANLKLLEKELKVTISSREGSLKIVGDEDKATLAARVVRSLMSSVDRGETLTEQSILYTISMANDGLEEKISALGSDCVCVTSKGKPIKSKTIGQKQYVHAMSENTIVFGIGPAGTGKTYLAVAKAVTALETKRLAAL